MTRMGAGELRIDQAVAASTAVWDASSPLAVSLSFGTYRLSASQTFKKKVVIRNYSNTVRTYNIANTYRDAPNTLGVTLFLPSTVTVPANGSAQITVGLTVTPALLPAWTLNGGSLGGNGELLNTVEYAGYLSFASGTENVHVPWHILPHKAAAVTPSSSSLTLGGSPAALGLSNTTGATTGQVDLFSLTGTGTQFPPSALPTPGSDITVANLRAAGVRLICTTVTSGGSCAAYGVQFAFNTFGQRSHPDVPAGFQIDLDLNNDGTPDLAIYNEDIGFATTGTFSGQNGVFVADFTNNTASGPYAYTIADLDSANVIFTAPLSALVTSTSLSLHVNTPFSYYALAFDVFFTGSLTDLIGPMQYELDSPRYFPNTYSVAVPAGSSLPVSVNPNSAYNGKSQSQTGMLLMYSDGKTPEADLIAVYP